MLLPPQKKQISPGLQLKQELLAAFYEAGGKKWLVELAETHPTTFASMIAKCIPNEITGKIDEHVTINVIQGVPRREPNNDTK